MKKILLTISMALAVVLVVVSNSGKASAVGDLNLDAGSITSSSFILSWDSPILTIEESLDYFEIFRNGTSLATTTGNTFSISGLSESTLYNMKVEAYVNDGTSTSFYVDDEIGVTTLSNTINITNVAELRDAIENQADGQTWNIGAGDYGLSSFSSISAGGQTGWYFPITVNDITINGAGIGQTIIYGDEFSQNGNWAKQNFVAIFGDNVTINGMTLMNKVQPNKVIEVIGNNSTIKNISVEFNTKVDPSVFDNVMHNMTNDEARQWTGSIYYNDDAGLVQTIQTLENVSIKNGGISSHAPNATINVNNVTLEYSSDIFWINDYRFYNSANSAINGTVDYIYHVNSTLNNMDVVIDSIGDPTTVLGTEVLELDSDISTDKQITLAKAVTFNGNGNTISPTFTKTDNSNNSVIGIQTDDIKINNLVIDGDQGTDLHGINVFRSKNVEINSVTVKNNDRTGLGVNGSDVKVTDIATENNGWHGINVDKLDADNNKSRLEILFTSNHQEVTNIPDIYVDDLTKGEVVDVDGQYAYLDDKFVTGDRFYKLTLSTPTLIYPSNNSSINTNDFWFDWDDVTNAVSYEFQASQSSNVDVDGSLTDSVWHGDYTGVEPTDSTAHSVGANGTWYWQVRAVSGSGVKSAWSEVWQMTIDTVAPEAPTDLSWTTSSSNVIANGGITDEYSGTASWTASVSSDVDHYIYKYWNAIDGNPYKVGSEYTTTVGGVSLAGSFNQGEGVHYYCVVAVDTAGNESACSDAFEITYSVNELPQATIVTPAEASRVSTVANADRLNVTGTFTDDVAVNYLQLELVYLGSLVTVYTMHYSDAGLNPDGTFSVDIPVASDLAEGEYSLFYTPTDFEGGVGPRMERRFVIDNTAPAKPTITTPVARQWFKTSPITNTWTAVTTDVNDNAEVMGRYQVAYNYDDGHTFGGVNACPGLTMAGVTGFIGCRDVNGTSRNHSPANSEQGGVTIWVRAIDQAGNAGAWSKSVHYYFDSTAPATDINVSEVATGTFTVSGTATDNLALNRVYVQLVSRVTGARCGGTTINLITTPFSTSSPWSREYDIDTFGGESCPDGLYAAHVEAVDMAGNRGSAGWTDNFLVTGNTNDGDGDDEDEGGNTGDEGGEGCTESCEVEGEEENGGGNNGGGNNGGGSFGGGAIIPMAFVAPVSTPVVGQVLGATAYQFTKDLSVKRNTTDDEVKALQKFLNLKGFTVSTSGAGSVGNETNFFGPKTRDAVIRYQEANPFILERVEIFDGVGTGNFYWSTRGFVNEILLNDSETSALLSE